jgi:hypothetical protein
MLLMFLDGTYFKHIKKAFRGPSGGLGIVEIPDIPSIMQGGVCSPHVGKSYSFKAIDE